MLGLVLVLPLSFASPETIPFSSPSQAESVAIVTKLNVCTDDISGTQGYCLTLTANRAEMVFFIMDGSLHSITAKAGTFTYTWKW